MCIRDFVMEILELHEGNTSIGIHITGNLSDVSARVHHIMRETGALRPPAYISFSWLFNSDISIETA
jgi:hypothetical protein